MQPLEHRVDAIADDLAFISVIPVCTDVFGRVAGPVRGEFTEIKAGQIAGDVYVAVLVCQVKAAFINTLVECWLEGCRYIGITQNFRGIPFADSSLAGITEQIVAVKAARIVVFNRGCKPFFKPGGKFALNDKPLLIFGRQSGGARVGNQHRVHGSRHARTVIVVHEGMHHFMDDGVFQFGKIRVLLFQLYLSGLLIHDGIPVFIFHDKETCIDGENILVDAVVILILIIICPHKSGFALTCCTVHRYAVIVTFVKVNIKANLTAELTIVRGIFIGRKTFSQELDGLRLDPVFDHINQFREFLDVQGIRRGFCTVDRHDFGDTVLSGARLSVRLSG